MLQDKEATDLHHNMMEFLRNSEDRHKVDSPEKLAYFIIDRCAGNVLDQTLIKEKGLQFLQFFEESIDELVSLQSHQSMDKTLKNTDGRAKQMLAVFVERR